MGVAGLMFEPHPPNFENCVGYTMQTHIQNPTTAHRKQIGMIIFGICLGINFGKILYVYDAA
jgi:hypothetical protein